MGYPLEKLCGWVSNATSKIQKVAGELQSARARIQALGSLIADLLNKMQQVESAIASTRSQIGALESQLSNVSDDEDSGAAEAIRSQISALQGRLAQYEALRSQIGEAMRQARVELAEKQQEESSCCSKLQEMDAGLEEIDREFEEHLRTDLAARDPFSRMTSERFGSSGIKGVNVAQGKIDTCLSYRGQISNLRQYISQLLGSSGEDRDERQKTLSRGRSR